MVNITRDEAIALFTALGSKTADKWGRKQMTEKIRKVDEMIDTEIVIPPDIEPVLNSVLTAIEDEEEIIVTKEHIETTPVEVDEEGTLPESNQEILNEEPKTYSMVSEEASNITEKTIDDLMEEDPPKNLKVKKPDGIRIVKSRSYYAGIVIRKHGISAGVTEAMVNELDKMYKKRNRQESMYRLRLAWHAIYGFCGLGE